MKNINAIYEAFLNSKGVNTDTRTLRSGQLFFALRGENFNANDFALKAIDEGCLGVVADEPRPEFLDNKQIFIVSDSLMALQELARVHRRHLKIPIVGLTGSNGKTTSKELLAAALSSHYQTFATKGNLNNHIGVPLSILSITNEHEIAVIEMGANHQKEIEFLCSIASPDVGFITNIGLAHLEGFGGEEGVYIGKKELFDYIKSIDGTIFCNLDDAKVKKAAGNYKYIGYGKSHDATYQGDFEITQKGLLVNWWRDNNPSEKHDVEVALTGSYNFGNVLSAVAVARFYGVSPAKIKKGIEAYRPTNNRSQIESTQKENTVIVDCYNANPSSMAAAIENVSLRPENKKVLILGDMLEVGEVSSEKHLEILNQAKEVRNAKILLVGTEFAKIKSQADIHFESTSQLSEYLKEHKIEHSLVLLKGSRKMKLETLLELL